MTPGAVGLLAPPAAGPGLACLLAMALRARSGASVAVAAWWSPSPRMPPGAPALRPARALAASLRARDVPAGASGVLVRAGLDEDEGTAARQARAVMAAAGACPVVVLFARARGAAMDGLVAGLDLVVVAGWPQPALGELSGLGLAEAGVRVTSWPDPPGVPARASALAGLPFVPAGAHPWEAP